MGKVKNVDKSYRPVIFITISVIMLLIVAPFVQAGQTLVLSGLDKTTVGLNDARTKALRSMLMEINELPALPGVALLVAQRGQVVFREAYGFSDKKAQKPFSADAVTAIASMTKPLTASCVMMLVHEGKINLDDKVSKYLPAFDNLKLAETGAAGKSPTIRQCLSHTSGFFGLRGASKEAMRAVRDFKLNLAESVDIIAQQKQLFLPGSRFTYGGSNYQVAARIVEVVTGKPFEVFMQERLLKPLKMDHTFFRPGPNQDLSRAVQVFWPVKDKGLVPLAKYDPDPERRLILASGGLYSSINDLAVFLTMHLNSGLYGGTRLLAQAAVTEMQKKQTGASKSNYGLGWFLSRQDSDGRPLEIFHGGLFGGQLWLDKEHDLAAVFLTTAFSRQQKNIWKDLRRKVSEVFGSNQ